MAVTPDPEQIGGLLGVWRKIEVGIEDLPFT
jgi:hypothetical protein